MTGTENFENKMLKALKEHIHCYSISFIKNKYVINANS